MADDLEGVVDARWEEGLDALGDVFVRFDQQAVGRAEIGCEIQLRLLGVARDDPRGARDRVSLDYVQADAAAADHEGGRARVHAGDVECGADSGGHAAAGQTCEVEGDAGIDLHELRLAHDRVLGEGAGPAHRRDGPAVLGEPCRPVRHPPVHIVRTCVAPAVRDVPGAAFVAGAARAVERDDDGVALRDAGHAGADLLDDARAFMTEHHGGLRDGALAFERMEVRAADPGSRDSDEDLAFARALDVDLLDGEGLLDLVHHCCAHACSPWARV